MKNLKTGNYTEFRDISDGSNLHCGELNMTNLSYTKPTFRKPCNMSFWFRLSGRRTSEPVNIPELKNTSDDFHL